MTHVAQKPDGMDKMTTIKAKQISDINSTITTRINATSINALSDVDTATVAPTNGQALVWESASSQWKPGTVSGGGGGASLPTVTTVTSFPSNEYSIVYNSSVIEDIYLISNESTAVTIRLPSTASAIAGYKYQIKRIGTAIVTIDANASETIDGQLSIILYTQYSAVTIVSDGSNWHIV